MFKKSINVFGVVMFTALLLFSGIKEEHQRKEEELLIISETVDPWSLSSFRSPVLSELEQFEPVEEAPVEEVAMPQYSNEEMIELCKIVLAEAEGECELGQRLVVDVVLNRVDDPRFPNTIHDVIYQPYQFTSINNGRYDKMIVGDAIWDLVSTEIMERNDESIIFFTAGRYGQYGTPAYNVENHYFCTY